MCGIAGFAQQPPQDSAQRLEEILAPLIRSLRHRGPDGEGIWVDAPAGVALGHRRLSIIDLSPLGNQPMISASGRYVLTFNGEIYNFPTLRRELEGLQHRFRGHSDTEVMLAGFEQWDVVSCLEKFWGMFAFALWDRQERKLTLARDRLGKKPLYYSLSPGFVGFASELKALRHPSQPRVVDRNMLALFLRRGQVPAPYSIFQDIQKLQPGYFLQIDCACYPLRLSSHRPYWSVFDCIRAHANTKPMNPLEAEEALFELLSDSVKLRLQSDAPLGAFLSGGTDSSLLVALAQQLTSKPIKTFSIGFHEPDMDEAPYAREVARHLGTEHHESYIDSQTCLDLIPKLPQLYDEPFADSSQIPTHIVSLIARQQVTVAISGDGGDELFFGYDRYIGTLNRWALCRRIPWPTRLWLQKLGKMLNSSAVCRYFAGCSSTSGPGVLYRRFQSLLQLAGCRNLEDYYQQIMSFQFETAKFVRGSQEPPTVFQRTHLLREIPDLALRLQFLDLCEYLPDDILTKVDRSSMGASLEARAPFLDHRVVEFALGLPYSLKRNEGQNKWLLKRLLMRFLPQKLVFRPKKGFAIPLADWLRGPLRDWVSQMLEPVRLQNQGYFEPKAVETLWLEHASGIRNHDHQIWSILMFQVWLSAGA